MAKVIIHEAATSNDDSGTTICSSGTFQEIRGRCDAPRGQDLSMFLASGCGWREAMPPLETSTVTTKQSSNVYVCEKKHPNSGCKQKSYETTICRVSLWWRNSTDTVARSQNPSYSCHWSGEVLNQFKQKLRSRSSTYAKPSAIF